VPHVPRRPTEDFQARRRSYEDRILLAQEDEEDAMRGGKRDVSVVSSRRGRCKGGGRWVVLGFRGEARLEGFGSEGVFGIAFSGLKLV